MGLERLNFMFRIGSSCKDSMGVYYIHTFDIFNSCISRLVLKLNYIVLGSIFAWNFYCLLGIKLVCYGILANCKYLYFMTNFEQCFIKMVSYFFYIVTSPVQVR